MQRALVVAVALALAAGSAVGGCPFPNYNIGEECCNFFGEFCAGACWNSGCLTDCDKGKFGSGLQASCLGTDAHYNCCPNGSKCKSECKALSGECCCTGELVEIISLSGVLYSQTQTSAPDASSMQVTLVNKGTNAGSAGASAPSLTTTLTTTQTSSWTLQSATKISISAKVKAGVPFVGEGEFTVGAEETFSYGETKTTTMTQNVMIDTGKDTIPPFSRKVWEFAGDIQVLNVAFTALAEIRTDCGGTVTQTVNGNMKISGITSFIKGNYQKLAGPTVPIECRSPFDLNITEQLDTKFCPEAPSARCVDNVLCKRVGLHTGTCCAPGKLYGCCNVAEAHPTCGNRYPADTVVCPAASGYFDECCKAPSVAAAHAAHSDEDASFDVHVRFSSGAQQKQEPAPIAAPEPTYSVHIPVVPVRVVLANATQERRRPTLR
jgi:hypothetical protein